jgi:hypothetical protein
MIHGKAGGDHAKFVPTHDQAGAIRNPGEERGLKVNSRERFKIGFFFLVTLL